MPSQPDAWTLQPRAAGSKRAPSYGPSRPAAPVASSSWPPVVKYYDGKYSDYFHRFMPRHRLIHVKEINLKYRQYRDEYARSCTVCTPFARKFTTNKYGLRPVLRRRGTKSNTRRWTDTKEPTLPIAIVKLNMSLLDVSMTTSYFKLIV